MTGSTSGANEDGASFYQSGEQAEKRGQFVEAVHAYKQAIAAFRAAGDRLGERHALCALGSVAKEQKLTQQAIQYYEQALTIDRALGDRRLEAITLGLLSNMSIEQGRYTEAARYLEESLANAEAIGDVEIAHAARTNLDAIRRARRHWLWRLLRLG